MDSQGSFSAQKTCNCAGNSSGFSRLPRNTWISVGMFFDLYVIGEPHLLQNDRITPGEDS